MIFHRNQPSAVAYAKAHEEYYRDTNPDRSLTHRDAQSVFAGLHLKDLFIFAMAVGKYHAQSRRPPEPRWNISVPAMSEQQRWALLAIELSSRGEVLDLNDEHPFYYVAEGYACAGMDIIVDEIERMGFLGYCEHLEQELTDILGE